MKDQLRRIEPLRALKRAAGRLASERADFRETDIAQKALIAQWRQLEAAGTKLAFTDVGFQNYSEFEEDGILLYLFTVLGTTNRTVVEISSQDGRICMSSNLVVHHRWNGFLYDADPVHIRSGRQFFEHHPATKSSPPKIESRWFDRDNIDDILRADGVPSEIDLLVLDIDGNDLHLWDALTWARPRVLLCEFNNAVPHDRALTVPYDPAFRFTGETETERLYRSASIKAFDLVSRAKGYRYVGCNALGFNAFFVRDDLGADRFPAVELATVDALAFSTEMRAKHWPGLSTRPWADLDTPEGRAGFRSFA